MKRIVSSFITLTMVLGLIVLPASAEVSSVSADYAAFLSGDFYGHNSMTIQGSVYTANGDVRFDNTGRDNKVLGDIVMSSLKQYIDPSVGKPKPTTITGSIIPVSPTSFNEPKRVGIDAPVAKTVTNNQGPVSIASWGQTTVINQDTKYTSLSVSTKVNIDATSKDITIIADSFNLTSSGEATIEILGNHNVYIFAPTSFTSYNKIKISGNGNVYIVSPTVDLLNNASIDIPGSGKLYCFAQTRFKTTGSSTLNKSGDYNKAYLQVSENIDITGTSVNTNIFVDKATLSLNFGSTITGNIIANNTTTLNITGAGTINGIVYAPLAVTTISGSGIINGRLVAKSLEIFGDSSIIYNPIYNQTFGEYFEPIATPTPVPTATPAPTAEPTVEPTAVPTAEPTAVPTTEPTAVPTVEPTTEPTAAPTEIPNDIPVGPEVTIEFPYAYLYGYEDGNVGADDSIKREEAAALVYRLLKQDGKTDGFVRPTEPTFTDVKINRWSYSALEYMAYIGMYNTSAKFVGPSNSIARGEVAKVMAFAFRIRPDSSKPGSLDSFTDMTKDNQYYVYIKAMYDKGIMEGNGDGTMRPDDVITRAEFVTMVNRIIGRSTANYYIDNIVNPYPDFDENTVATWKYENIILASFGFTQGADGVFKMDPTKKPPRETIDYN